LWPTVAPRPPFGRPPLQRGVTYQEFLEWRSRARTLDDAFAVAMGEMMNDKDLPEVT